MPKAKEAVIRLRVDGEPLREYAVSKSSDGVVECYVASEEGKVRLQHAISLCLRSAYREARAGLRDTREEPDGGHRSVVRGVHGRLQNKELSMQALGEF